MGEIYIVFKEHRIFDNLRVNNPIFIHSIDLKSNWTITQTDDWKDICIASKLTISFLIDNNNLNMFLNWEFWPGLNDDISFDEYENKFYNLKKQKIDLTRTLTYLSKNI